MLVPVNWQDELRQLDQELAAGKVTAEEYRNRRDAVLAQTAGSGGAPQQQPPQAQPQSQWTRGQQYPPSGPIPTGAADRTQMVSQPPPPPQQSPPAADADKTQVVSGQQMPQGGNESTQVFGRVAQQPPDNPERTQVVTGFGGRPQPGPQQQQQPDDAPLWGGSTPPWSGGEFPPLGGGGRGNEPWYSQGPEVFDKRGGGKGKIFAIVGVVVVIAALAVVFFVVKPFSGKSPQQQAGSTTHSAPPTTTTPPGPMAQVSGSQTPNAVHEFTDVVPLGFLTQQEVTAYQSGAPGETYFSDVTSGQNKVLVLIVKTASQSDAATVTQSLAQLEVGYSMQPRTGGPVGVSIETADTAQGGPLRRAEYSSGAYVVRIQVQGTDPASADQELTSVLNAQLKRLPAND
ncbi:MAG TPA: hypothetical protein VG247_10100 [Pseudonocardiaceae bacterium]|nr:hypothetical protein [Pseudonocardiaceae bacterium]